MVTSWAGSFKDVECMRLTYEPLMFKVRIEKPEFGRLGASCISDAPY
jgi:hypothetical protein